MGKNRKLRCFFRLGRNKGSSSSIDDKLSLPNLTQKCPTSPNQYFRSGKDHEMVMGTGEKGLKLDVIETGDIEAPPNRKDFSIQEDDLQVDLNGIVEDVNAFKVNSSSCVQHQPSGNKQSPPTGDSDSECDNIRSFRAQNVTSVNTEAHVHRTASKLSKKEESEPTESLTTSTPIHQPQHIEERPNLDPVSKTEPRENSKLTFQKEYPISNTKKCTCSVRGKMRDSSFPISSDDTPAFKETEALSSGVTSFSTEWNASGACKVTASSFGGSGSCSCGQCRPGDEPVKDWDWGWFTDIGQKNVESVSTSLHVTANSPPTLEMFSLDCRSDIQLHTYVNDDRPSFHLDSSGNRRSSEEEIAFTITERSGRSIQVTITRSEPKHHCVQDRCRGNDMRNVKSRLTSRHVTAEYDLAENDRIDKYPPHCGVACHSSCRNRPSSSHNNMTPSRHTIDRENRHQDSSAKPRPKMSKDPGPNESFQREKKSSNPTKDTHRTRHPDKSPHFQLSMASYSKLIAYCDTNKLLVGPSMERSDKGNAKNYGQAPTSTSRTNQSEFAGLHGVHQPSSTSSNNTGSSRSSNGHSQSASVADTAAANDLCRLAKVLETVEECPWYWGAITGQDSRSVLRNSPNGTFLLRDSSDPRYLFSLSVKTKQGPTSIRIVYSDGAFRFDSEMDDANSRRQNPHHRHGNSRSDGRGERHHNSSHPNYVKRLTPVFTCVIRMILFYTNYLGLSRPWTKNAISANKDGHRSSSAEEISFTHSEEERPGSTPEQFMCYWVNRNGRQEIPVLLSQPKTQGFPSLQRLCRQSLSVSQNLWANEHKIDQFPLPNSVKKYIKKYPYPI